MRMATGSFSMVTREIQTLYFDYLLNGNTSWTLFIATMHELVQNGIKKLMSKSKNSQTISIIKFLWLRKKVVLSVHSSSLRQTNRRTLGVL